jgi:hypothetical protein
MMTRARCDVTSLHAKHPWRLQGEAMICPGDRSVNEMYGIAEVGEERSMWVTPDVPFEFGHCDWCRRLTRDCNCTCVRCGDLVPECTCGANDEEPK